MGHDALEIDPANAAQAQAWDGDEGRYWAENADGYSSSWSTWVAGNTLAYWL